MASTVQTVTRRVVTRRWNEIDPKVVGVFAVAIATIALVAAAYVVAGIVGAQLGPGLASAVVPVVLAAIVGYARRSSHGALVDEGARVAGAIVEAIAPVVKQAAPGSDQVVDDVVDDIALLEQQLDQPTEP